MKERAEVGRAQVWGEGSWTHGRQAWGRGQGPEPGSWGGGRRGQKPKVEVNTHHHKSRKTLGMRPKDQMGMITGARALYLVRAAYKDFLGFGGGKDHLPCKVTYPP